MKLRENPNSIRPQIFEHYEHPWYRHADNKLIKPNPPSKEAVERAQFKDKTYHWQRDDSVRPRDKRSSK